MASQPEFLSRSTSWWLDRIRRISRFGPLLLPIVLLIPILNGFPYPSAEAEYSDLVITHFPNAYYLKSAITQWKAVPLWSSTIMSGYPFCANPLSGLYYPPGWLALLMPLPFGFNLLVLLHLLWGGIGAFLLIKSEGAGHWGAVLGSIAFAAMPKLYAHYGAGHLTLLYAIPWTPWLLLVSRSGRLISEPKADVSRTMRWMPAICLAMTFFADVRWAFYAGVIWIAYIVINNDYRIGKQQVWFVIRNIAAQLIVTTLLIAPLALPLGQFVSQSTRASITQQESFALSLPISRLLGLIYPDFGGFHEWMIYPGILIFMLFVLRIFARNLNRIVKFWVLTAILCWIFSLGVNIPLLSNLARLPLLGLLRVPPRASFLSGLALAVVAAHGYDMLIKKKSEENVARGFLAAVGLAFFTLTLAIVMLIMSGNFERNLIWAVIISILGIVGVGLMVKRHEYNLIWSILVLGLVVVDLGITNSTLYSSRSEAQTLEQGTLIATYVADPDTKIRIYSPSYSMPQQTAAIHALELADGVDPMQLANYAAYMEVATGVIGQGYQLSIPAFAGGDPSHDNVEATPDERLLGLLNVKYVVASYPIDSGGLDLQTNLGGIFVYENREFKPRAWVQPIEDSGSDNLRTVEITRYEANRIELNAVGPGTLVISEIHYPGWYAQMDGEPVEMTVAYDLLRGIELPAGRHEVSLSFRPMSLYIGVVMAIVGWVIILFSTFRQGLRRDVE